METDRAFLKTLDLLLLLAHVLIDGYFFLVVIPTNILGSYELKLFNLLFAAIVGAVTLFYNLRRSFADWHCPITDWRNIVARKLKTKKKLSDTAIGSLLEKLRGRPVSLQAVNRIVYAYIFLVILSFLPAF